MDTLLAVAARHQIPKGTNYATDTAQGSCYSTKDLSFLLTPETIISRGSWADLRGKQGILQCIFIDIVCVRSTATPQDAIPDEPVSRITRVVSLSFIVMLCEYVLSQQSGIWHNIARLRLARVLLRQEG